MSDLVERLRENIAYQKGFKYPDSEFNYELLIEAINEIERLRAEIAEMKDEARHASIERDLRE